MENLRNFIFSYEINLIFRMIIACICGIMIGFERTNRAKEAGIRTHCIVACASAMMMIVSKYGFGDLVSGLDFTNADIRLDPSRMAQGIVTGVGFLGSGMIYHQRGSTQGLTTAAGVWATSGIGMAFGAGMYTIGISSTVIILIVQYILHSKIRLAKSHKVKMLYVYDVDEVDFQKRMIRELSDVDISVTDVSVSKNEGGLMDYTFCIELSGAIEEEELIRNMDYRCSLKYVN